ncbi:MAG: prenyltransferase/squalene oxidase repeat-containing protein [Candidatus Paceibacterota bacterium]
MKHIKKFLQISLVLAIAIIGIPHITRAEDEPVPPIECIPPQTLVENICTDPVVETEIEPEPILNVNLTIRDGDSIIFNSPIELEPDGMTEINGHSLNSNSVLAILNKADISSDNFEITDLQYYDSMNSFYLKCINSACDNWQYVVNDTAPGIGIDKKILHGNEEIYIYFSQQHKIILNSNSINTDEELTVYAKDYVYQNNSWGILTGVTIGLTQPDPNNPWSPLEIQTMEVNENGEATFSSIPAGSYDVGIKEDYYFPTETLNINLAPEITRTSGGSYISIPEFKKVFDIEKAINFLISQQKEDGSFGQELYTDWVAIALSTNPEISKTSLEKITNYLLKNKLTGTLLTDYERRAMSLMSLNLNPYNTNGENYIKKITDSFDGTQFGDKNMDNDDIFALIVLQNADFEMDEKIITETINFLLLKQKEDGSWDNSVDLTSAGIEALSIFIENSKIKESLNKAKNYLKENQKNDGGWDNISSTTWAMQGILALGEEPTDWVNNYNTPFDYLALNQDTDGGIEEENIENRIWQTAYSVTSSSNKTWTEIMQKFEKPSLSNKVVGTTNTTINPLLQKTISTSHQAKFSKELEKYTKTIEKEEIKTEDLPEPKITTKKINWFKRILNIIFGF